MAETVGTIAQIEISSCVEAPEMLSAALRRFAAQHPAGDWKRELSYSYAPGKLTLIAWRH